MSRAPFPEADDNHGGDDDGDGDSEWRFGVNDIGPNDTIDDEPEVEQLPIGPEPPRAGNIVFVLLGVLLVIGLVVITVYPGAL